MLKFLPIAAALLVGACSPSTNLKTPTPPKPVPQNELVSHGGYRVPQDVTSSVNYTVYADGTSSFVQRTTGQTCFLDAIETENAQFGIIPVGCNLITNPADAPAIVGTFWVVHRTDASFQTIAKTGNEQINCDFPSTDAATAASEMEKTEDFCLLNTLKGEVT